MRPKAKRVVGLSAQDGRLDGRNKGSEGLCGNDTARRSNLLALQRKALFINESETYMEGKLQDTNEHPAVCR